MHGSSQQQLPTYEPHALDGPAGADLVASLREALAQQPPDDTGHSWELVGLMLAEPITGVVATAAWHADYDGGKLRYELVSADGEPMSDVQVLREALTLAAMCETLEELAEPPTVQHITVHLEGLAREGAGRMPAEMLVHVSVATDQMTWLADMATTSEEQPRVARAERLDALGNGLRMLESTWNALEAAASDVAGEAPDDAAFVEDMWRVLAMGRGTLLRVPVQVAVEQARHAGHELAQRVTPTMVTRARA